MAGKWSFEIEQGDIFERTIVYKPGGTPADLTDCVVELEIKPISSKSTFSYTTLDYISVSDPTSGQLLINIPDEITDTFNWTKAKYTLRITFADGSKRSILKGIITVKKEL